MNDKPTKENINFVFNAMKNSYEEMAANKKLNLDEWIEFMEQKFFEAGYRYSKNFPRTPSEQQNILIIHDAAAGDFILCSPAIRAIRKIYPDAKITLVVYTKANNLSECCPYIDEVIVNNSKPANWRSFPKMFQWNLELAEYLLTERFDISFSFAHHVDSFLLAYMSGAKVRVAPLYTEENAEYWPAIYCDLSYTLANRFSTIFAPQFLYGNHLVDTYLSLPETILHTPIKDRELEIFYSAKDMNTVREILSHYDGNFYALNFGGDDGRKRYPPENYAKIVKKIVAEDSDAKFFILGEEFDRQFLDVFKNNLDEKFIEEHLIDLIGQLTYRQSGVILKFCKMYIGNDTGTMHLAAAAKCPVLVTFPFPADLKNTKWDGVKMSSLQVYDSASNPTEQSVTGS